MGDRNQSPIKTVFMLAGSTFRKKSEMIYFFYRITTHLTVLFVTGTRNNIIPAVVRLFSQSLTAVAAAA